MINGDTAMLSTILCYLILMAVNYLFFNWFSGLGANYVAITVIGGFFLGLMEINVLVGKFKVFTNKLG